MVAVNTRTTIYIKEEVTEGTYVAPTAGSDAILPLSEGVELAPVREFIERSVLNSSIGKNTPRLGMKSVTGSLSVEAKAKGIEGLSPEYGLLVESALGSERSAATQTTTTGNTTTVLEFGALPNFVVGDIVLVKEAGAYHVSPVVATDATTITLLVAATAPFSDGVVVSAVQTYFTGNDNHPRISVTKYVEDAIEEQGVGMAVTSFAVANFTTGQLPQFDFSMEGLNYNRSVTSPSFTPVYDTSKPPIALSACVYLDGQRIQVNDFSFSVSNSLGFVSSTCSPNGKISSRVTERSITGTINPYKETDDVDNFNLFNEGTTFSLFAYAGVPTGVTGEFGDVVAFYMPTCQINEFGESDLDGILQDDISFMATRGDSNNNEELYISFI